jgi:hypothetical protein
VFKNHRPNVPELIVARLLQARGFRVAPLAQPSSLIPALALPDYLRFAPDFLAWRPNAQPRLLEIKSSYNGHAKIKLRALHAYEAWQAFAGLDLHLLAWSFASASLYAYPLDVVRSLMRSRPVERFYDTHDEFVSIPLPKEPVDLNRW